MKWVHEFYTKQYLIFGGSPNEIAAYDQSRVEKVNAIVNKPVLKILELGGGQGGFAVAAAKQGHLVTVVDIVPSAVEQIHVLAQEHGVDNVLQVIQGDFYDINLSNDFDVVCYWDGFGIGSDDDQKRLLKRISDWLLPTGIALIDSYTPWYWAKVAGQEMPIGENSFRRYGFDAEGCRMLDTWWSDNIHEVTQSLRCYSPADLAMLTAETGLLLTSWEPGGAMDYENWIYHEKVSLEKAMSFLAMFTK